MIEGGDMTLCGRRVGTFGLIHFPDIEFTAGDRREKCNVCVALIEG